MAEQWRDIEGFPGYQVSDHGRMLGPRGVLTLQTEDSGHQHTMIRRSKVRVHRAVAVAFIGPPPFPGAFVLHNDDVPSNNVPSNLRWGTFQDNADDSERNGGRRHGEARPSAVLTDDQVVVIRARYRQGGVSLRALGAEFGVSHTAIRHICNESKWRHV